MPDLLELHSIVPSRKGTLRTAIRGQQSRVVEPTHIVFKTTHSTPAQLAPQSWMLLEKTSHCQAMIDISSSLWTGNSRAEILFYLSLQFFNT
jgi:hypothetical protein